MDNYHNEHGVYPEDFQKLNAIYQQFAKKIEQYLPNFTMCKEYFEKLKVITSLSYYYNSLKQEGREPTIESVKTQAAFPRVMPSIPVRYYQKHDIKITLNDILKLLEQSFKTNVKVKVSDLKELDKYMYQIFWEEDYVNCPENLHSAFFNFLSTIISDQIKDTNLDSKKINNLVDDILNIIQDYAIGFGDALIQASFDIIDTSFKKSFDEEIYKKLKLDKQVFDLLETPVGKIDFLKAQFTNSIKIAKNHKYKSVDNEVTKAIKETPANVRESINLHKQNKLKFEKNIASLNKQFQELTNKIEEDLKVEIAKIPSYRLSDPKVKKTIDDFKETQIAPIRQEVTEKTVLLQKSIDEADKHINKEDEYIKQDIEQIKKKQTELKAKIDEDMLKFQNDIVKLIDENHQKIQHLTSVILDNELSKKPLTGSSPSKPFIYLHSVLSTDNSQSVSHIVGGCSVKLNKDFTPVVIEGGKALQLNAKLNASENKFSQFEHQGVMYQAFQISTQLLCKQEHIEHSSSELIQKEGYSELMVSVLMSDEKSIIRNLKLGDVNQRLANGMTALYLAIQNCDEKAALCVLNNATNLDIDASPDSKITPLHLALQLDLDSVATKLIDMNANLKAARKADEYTAAHIAASMGKFKRVEQMCSKGFDINTVTSTGRKTMLHIAAFKNQNVTWLISNKIDVNLKDVNGDSAAFTAILNANTKTAAQLASKTSREVKNRDQQNIMLYAASNGMFDIA